MKVKLVITILIILVVFAIAFVMLGIAVNKHQLKKNKDDLLKYFKKHKDKLSITLKEDGRDTLTVNPDEKFPLASTMKLIIAFNFVKEAMRNHISISNKVTLKELDKFYIKDTDGGAHPNWKQSIGNPTEVSLLDIAKGMMQFSSNACTDFLINKIGIETINESIETLQLNNHDKITYLTPPVLMPGYVSDKRRFVRSQIDAMSVTSYQALSNELFEKMRADESDDLKEKVPKMLDWKMQRLITKKMASSTTKTYAELMYRLGANHLTVKEKDLFSDILIGKHIKNDRDDYFWYKSGSTLFVLTSALYKESQNSTISVSLFFEDEAGGELYWIRNIFNDFVLSIATDAEFRKKVKSLLS